MICTGAKGSEETSVRIRQGERFETYHLTCPVCSALPGTSCIDEDYRELAEIHPSRRVSIAERNRRRRASGWEPPELTERRIREHEARVARAPLFDPRLGPGVTAALEGRRPRSMVEPSRGPWSAGNAVQEAASDPAVAGAAEAGASAGGPPTAEDAWGWFAVYLGQYPEGMAVPRQILRDIADTRWIAAGNGPVPVSRARQLRRRMEGRSASISKGRRSSQQLAAHLRSFEELGLIRRDNARDAIIIIDPDGLCRLGEAPARVPQGTPADDRDGGSADCQAAAGTAL
jgi:hypothetical protein